MKEFNNERFKVQLRIVAPTNGYSYRKDAYEKMLYEVVRPVIKKHKNLINWFWFLNHGQVSWVFARDKNMQGESVKLNIPKDCEEEDFTYKSPDDPNGKYLFTTCFRFSTKSQYERKWLFWKKEVDTTLIVSKDIIQQCMKKGYGFYDPINYDMLNDLGGKRFCNSKKEDNRLKRMKDMGDLVYSMSKLYLGSVKRHRNGQFVLEKNFHRDNPNKTIFDSVHHLFCNGMKYNPIVYWNDKNRKIGGLSDFYHSSYTGKKNWVKKFNKEHKMLRIQS